MIQRKEQGKNEVWSAMSIIRYLGYSNQIKCISKSFFMFLSSFFFSTMWLIWIFWVWADDKAILIQVSHHKICFALSSASQEEYLLVVAWSHLFYFRFQPTKNLGVVEFLHNTTPLPQRKRQWAYGDFCVIMIKSLPVIDGHVYG